MADKVLSKIAEYFLACSGPINSNFHKLLFLPCMSLWKVSQYVDGRIRALPKGGAPEQGGQLIFSLRKFRFGFGTRDDPGAPEEVHPAAVDNARAQHYRELALAP